MPLFTFLTAILLKLTVVVTAPHAHQVRIKATTPEGTRVLAVALLSDAYSRESVFETGGGRRVYWVEWRDVPGGVYQVVGEARLDGGTVVQSAPVNVRVCCGGEG